MATSFGTNPLTYAHPAALCLRNLQYGPRITQRLNYYQNDTRLSGGNPVVVFLHGGGWKSNDKTTTAESAAQRQRILWAYLLAGSVYGSSVPPFDVASVEYAMHGRADFASAPLNTPYEPTIEGTTPGTGSVSFSSYFPTMIDDARRAVQWIRDNAARLGANGRVVLWGSSSGGWVALVAALTPGRAYLPAALAGSAPRWSALSPSTVDGVLNWFGPINFDPYYYDLRTSAPVFGIVENGAAHQRATMERLLLVPAADGTYPAGSAVSALCRAASPVYLIRGGGEAVDRARLRSYYEKTTPTALPGYSGVPPYTFHDSGQFADLAAECVAAGVPHSGRVLDVAADYGGDVQLAWESTCAESYSWLADRVA